MNVLNYDFVFTVVNYKPGFDLDTPASAGISGTELGTRYLAFELGKLGATCLILTRTDKLTTQENVTSAPIRYIEKVSSPVYVAATDCRPLLHARNNSKKIFWMHNPLNFEKSFRKKQAIPLLKIRPHAVFVGKKLEKRQKYYPLFQSRHIIGHGVANIFSYKSRIPPEPILIWTSTPGRGLARTLKIWRDRIAPQVPNARMIVTTTTAPPPGINTTELPNVQFLPRQNQEELAHLLSEARVMLYPGWEDETFCISAAEATCSGVPLVTEGIGSLSERVRHGETGFLCKGDDELARKTIALLTDDHVWQSMQAGCKEERELLLWPSVAQTWLKLGRGLIMAQS